MNIFFKQITEDDVVSKNSKKNLKRRLKKMVKDLDIEETKAKLNKTVDLMLSEYIKCDEITNYSFDFDVEDKDEQRNIVITMNKTQNIQKVNRDSLRQKLKNMRYKRNNPVTKKQMVAKEKKTKKTMRDDSRVTDEMIQLYYRARTSLPGNDIPTPMQILDDKGKYTNEFIQYLYQMIINLKGTKDNLFKYLDNDYGKYMSKLTDFDYKKFVTDMLSKFNKPPEVPIETKEESETVTTEVDETPKIEEVIDESTQEIDESTSTPIVQV